MQCPGDFRIGAGLVIAMRAFFRLLLWELASHWKQGLAIVVLLSCGIATLIMSITTMRSLEASQARYYAKYSFAHLW